MTTRERCLICRDPERARLIEADWRGGLSAPGIAARMAAAGWKVSSGAILNHLKQHVAGAATRQNVPAGMPRRDAAVLIKNRILDEIEFREQLYQTALEEAGDDPEAVARALRLRPNILEKDLQPALGTALKAEAVEAKREDNAAKRKIDLFQLMLGGADGRGALAPPHLIGDGTILEGEVAEVDDDDA